MPIMPFMGVRISWLILARKILLAALAASALSLGLAQHALVLALFGFVAHIAGDAGSPLAAGHFIDQGAPAQAPAGMHHAQLQVDLSAGQPVVGVAEDAPIGPVFGQDAFGNGGQALFWPGAFVQAELFVKNVVTRAVHLPVDAAAFQKRPASPADRPEKGAAGSRAGPGGRSAARSYPGGSR